MSSTFVTSHLVVGDEPTKVSGHIVKVDTPEEAVSVIEAGGTAVLPGGSWDAAATVLRLFGASEEHVRFQIDTAKRPSEGSVPAHP